MKPSTEQPHMRPAALSGSAALKRLFWSLFNCTGYHRRLKISSCRFSSALAISAEEKAFNSTLYLANLLT